MYVVFFLYATCVLYHPLLLYIASYSYVKLRQFLSYLQQALIAATLKKLIIVELHLSIIFLPHQISRIHTTDSDLSAGRLDVALSRGDHDECQALVCFGAFFNGDFHPFAVTILTQ